MKRDIIENAQEVGFYYRIRELLDDEEDSYRRGSSYDVDVSIHYPGQFLLDTSKAIKFTFGVFDKRGYILHRARDLIVDILSIEILKRRKNRRHDCFKNWRPFDETVLNKHIMTIGCSAPYHPLYKDFPTCNNEDDIRRSAYKFNEVRLMYYPKACWRISKLDYSKQLNFKFNRDKYWKFTVQYPEDIKIVTQSKEVDEHALVGNIGGYIGLFLGTSS